MTTIYWRASGSFGGLMEALRSVSPLLADERVTTLKALARARARGIRSLGNSQG